MKSDHIDDGIGSKSDDPNTSFQNQEIESNGESETPAQKRSSSSSDEELIKVRLGNLELPVSPDVLDDLQERSRNGEGDMEFLLSKYVMEEIAKAIKQKTEKMLDSSKLETEFVKEIEKKVDELSKSNKRADEGIETGVLKPKEERDYFVKEVEAEHVCENATKRNNGDQRQTEPALEKEEINEKKDPQANTETVCGNASEKFDDFLYDRQSDFARFPEIAPQQEETDYIRSIRNPDTGEAIVRFSQVEWGEMVMYEEKLTLIGRFVKQRPPLDAIRRTIGAALRLEGGIEVGSLNHRTVLLRFNLESDCRKAWLRCKLTIEGATVWLSRWTPDWNVFRDSPQSLEEIDRKDQNKENAADRENNPRKGVLKPSNERDFYVPSSKPNYLDNNPIDRMLGKDDENQGKQKIVAGGQNELMMEGAEMVTYLRHLQKQAGNSSSILLLHDTQVC
nr:TMV resistance protein N-like [Ipomoea batatas]